LGVLLLSLLNQSQVLVVNPHRGASGRAVNTDVTSLSMLVKRLGAASTDDLPVHNLSAPISMTHTHHNTTNRDGMLVHLT
jgi:hypothetical protein